MLQLQAVFFDLAGTLIKVRGGIGSQYARVAREFGVDVEPAAIDAEFANAFRSAGWMGFDAANGSDVAALEKVFWKKVVRLIFAAVGAERSFGSRFDDYFSRLFAYFATATPWEVYPDTIPALEALRRRGLITGLITNFDLRVFPLLDALGLERYFDSVTIPAIAGAAKPERRIFLHALAAHRLRPDEAVQVGDSLSEDVDGARQAGLRAVLLARKETPTPAGAIRSLAELPAFLGLA